MPSHWRFAHAAVSMFGVRDNTEVHIAKQQSDDDESERLPAHENPGQIEQAIFCTLVSSQEQRPWSVREMEMELGSPIAVEDSLRRLQAGGLIHRCGDFVWATRAAILADEVAL